MAFLSLSTARVTYFTLKVGVKYPHLLKNIQHNNFAVSVVLFAIVKSILLLPIIFLKQRDMTTGDILLDNVANTILKLLYLAVV